MIPEYPPRVRVEWLIASSRIVLAGGALLAVAVSPSDPLNNWSLAYALGWYLVYSLLVLGLVWTPVRFARGWGVAQHAFDLAAFSLFNFFTDAATSPFFAYFTFLVICGTLRWESRGAAWTAIVTAILYAGTSLLCRIELALRPFLLNTFLIRIVHLAVVALLVGYLGAHHHRFQRELGRLVTWPRRVPRKPHELAAELVSECSEVLEASRVLIVWEEPEDGSINLAWGAGADVTLATEPEATYGAFVVSGLERGTFQTTHANDDGGVVIHWSAGAFRKRIGRPIHPALRARFDMDACAVVEPRRGIDPRPAVRAGQAAHADRRFDFRRARGAARGLAARQPVPAAPAGHGRGARRAPAAGAGHPRQPAAVGRGQRAAAAWRRGGCSIAIPAGARQRLEEVQDQLEHGELEMRAFIRRLRPFTQKPPDSPVAGLDRAARGAAAAGRAAVGDRRPHARPRERPMRGRSRWSTASTASCRKAC